MATYDNIKFTKGSDIVYIGVKLAEENIINEIKVINVPTTDTTPETTQVLNLNRVEDRFIITGNLVFGKLDASETKTSGKDKKDLLKTMFAKGSVVVMTYESTNFNVSVDKFNIKYMAKDNTDSVDGEVVYDVIITCVVGADVI